MYRTLIAANELLSTRTADWVTLDCRFDLMDTQAGEAAWHRGHLPGAHYLNLDTQLAGRKNGVTGRHPLPDAQTLAKVFSACGVGSETQVVVYDNGEGMFAARAWWLLRWLGHEPVAVLDGGLPAWLAVGGRLEQQAPPDQDRRFSIGPARLAAVTVAQVEHNLAQPRFSLVDARAPQRFAGIGETLDPVGGHIPGALNRFFRDNFLEDGRYKPAEVLRREWQSLLGPIEEGHAVVHQCGSGVSACVNLLAMELAGLPGSRLYPGSWSEWCADPARPVERAP